MEVAIALGVGLLKLILDRRADRRLHEIIHEQHQLTSKIHNQINEQNEIIKFMQKMSKPDERRVSNKDS